MNRTQYLKEKAFENGKNPNKHTEQQFWVNKALTEGVDEFAHNIKRARIDCMLFDNYSIEIDKRELIAGRYSNNFKLTPKQRKTNETGKLLWNRNGFFSGARQGDTGHRVLDYEKLLNTGIKGILAEVETHLNALDYSDPDACGKKAFYTSVKISLEGVCRFAKRYHDALTDLYETEKNASRKEEYRRMSENFAHAPYEPCEHFYEAIQCMWFIQFCFALIGDYSLTGRPDSYLYPFYEKDLAQGFISRDFAFELIENMFLKHNELYDTWPAPVMVGGVDRQGNPVWNELSYMCIQAIETTGLINPSVAVCYNKDMPEDLLSLCIAMIAKGYTRPSIFNDKVIQEGLLNAGVSVEDARYYIHSTCVEITPIGASNILVATPYINLNKALEYVFNNQSAYYGEKCRVEPPVDFSADDLKTFEGFYAVVKKAISGIIRSYLIDVCEYAYSREKYMSAPLASAFTNGCLERGKDAVAGGARYNFVYPCFPGFLNLVDSLAAVKTAVYREKAVTLEELGNLCKANYEGGERIRQYLINKCPKFGNGIDEVDSIGVELYDLIRHELQNYRISIGGTFHPSYFAWVMHGVLGSRAGATPDGRKQGEALSECLGSVQGLDKNGPAGVLNSIAKIDQKYGIGGIATNFRFSKAFIQTEKGKQSLADFIKTFMQSDCFEIQFNVVDQADLIEAQKRPDKYKTLMVRVAGYSDYFVNLDSKIQDEIIKRSEHASV